MKHNFANAKVAGAESFTAPICGLGTANYFLARSPANRVGLVSQPGLQLLPSAKNFSRPSARRGAAAFTLVDALLAAGILVIFVAACLTAIFTNQIVTHKAKEEAIAMDFLTKYIENIKALPFASAGPGLQLNWQYNITIPADTNWVALDTTNYNQFYNDLAWLANRNPKLSVNVRQNSTNGIVHDKQFNLRFDWDPPLNKGRQLEVQVDFLLTANVPSL